ncbi:hypothetical protein FNV43_RR15386 [Rhamnella rubrinervis]|uniref:COMM domain-containing protein n=1 Tax=Rhamnella rubrinervis TaxID=2594499 RepID=A0A8K0ECQ9_9ROSA|nr:hypothetical protein FNV43_RR15386 [Rhamnella rubrinervis]
MDEDTLYLQLHKLSGMKSEEALDQLVSTLWKTRKTGLRSYQDKSHLQSLLNLPSISDLDPVHNELSDKNVGLMHTQLLACLRSLIRKCVYGSFTGDDLLKLFPADLPIELQSILLVLFQKHQSQWMEDISREQRSLPRTSISNQVKEGAPPIFTSLPSSSAFAPLWPRQDDPVDRLNQNDFEASTPIISDTNVSRLASLRDVGPPENLGNLPRLKSMNWTMDNCSSGKANRSAIISLKMQDYTKSTSGEIEVKFQLTRDTLEAMLRSMTYISEQLSGMAGSSLEPMQKKQKQ